MTDQRIIVLVPFRNVGSYIVDCVDSIFRQKYANFQVHLLDDYSTDSYPAALLEKYAHVQTWRNPARLGPMENIYRALLRLKIEDDDVVVLLDGDDYIFGERSFQILNEYYAEGALLTYGQYITTDGIVGHCTAYTEDEVKRLRQAPWKASHLKTFKYKLFKALLEQDPEGSNFKYHDGTFFMASSDMGIMIPLIEIAGYRNIKFIPNVLYCYRLHPNNDHASEEGRMHQLRAVNHIRGYLSPLNQSF